MRKIALLMAFAFVIVACTGGTTDTTPDNTQIRNEINTVASEPATLDPHRTGDVGSHRFVGKLFANLVRQDVVLCKKTADNSVLVLNNELCGGPENIIAFGLKEITQNPKFIEMVRNNEVRLDTVVVPDLASSVPLPEYNDNGTVSYTFSIRKEAKFANGKPLTAWDVAFSLDRAADPKTRSTTVEPYNGDILGVWDMVIGKTLINRVSPIDDEFWIDLPGVEVLDDYTIRLTIDSPKEYFLKKLTYPASSVVDKVETESPGRWTDDPNSSGPYIIAKKSISEIVLEVNPNYHGDKPIIPRIRYFLTGGEVFLRFQNGDLDFAGVGIVDLDLLDKVRDSSSELSKQYFAIGAFSTSYVGFNTQIAPFDDPLVRQAFAYAINKDELVELMEDLVVKAEGILPPGFHAYRENFKGIEYDPDKARELLSQSRYADNMPRIKFTLSGGGSGAPSLINVNLVDQLRNVLDLEIEFETMDYSTYLQELNKGTIQMYSFGWVADYNDAEDFLDIKFHSSRAGANNETRYVNDVVDRLLEIARTEADPQKRVELYQQVEDIIVNDVPWLVLFHGKTSVIVSDKLCGYFPAPMGIPNSQYLYFCNA